MEHYAFGKFPHETPDAPTDRKLAPPLLTDEHHHLF